MRKNWLGRATLSLTPKYREDAGVPGQSPAPTGILHETTLFTAHEMYRALSLLLDTCVAFSLLLWIAAADHLAANQG